MGSDAEYGLEGSTARTIEQRFGGSQARTGHTWSSSPARPGGSALKGGAQKLAATAQGREIRERRQEAVVGIPGAERMTLAAEWHVVAGEVKAREAPLTLTNSASANSTVSELPEKRKTGNLQGSARFPLFALLPP